MLNDKEQIYYSRHTRLPNFGEEKQLLLKSANVLVIGAGGLGCPVLSYLTAAGVGHITIMDGDRVDMTNLHRQVLFTTNDIGFSKAKIAKQRLEQQNPYVQISAISENITKENALSMVRQVDVVIDCSDNFATRYLVNDACVIEKKPLVYGAIDQFGGQLSVFNYKNGPTYRCLFPEPPAPEEAPNCSDVGVLGVLPGIIGCYQAIECIKIITEIGETLSGRFLIIDTLGVNHRELKIVQNPENLKISELGNYDPTTCEVDVPSVTYDEFKAMDDIFLLDVREEYEFQQRHIDGHLIPLNSLPDRIDELPRDKKIVVMCAKGIRSWHACQFLQSHHFDVVNLEGGLSAIPY